MTSGLPLTAAQLGIWLGQALAPESSAYWAAEYVVLEGPVDVVAFRRAHRTALSEVEALRARFELGDEGPLFRLDAELDAEPAELDFSAAPDPELAARSWMQASLASAVDLAQGPLFKSALLCLSAERHFWFFRAHHIALDGYGFSLVQAEVAKRYSALVAGEPMVAGDVGPGLAELCAEDRRYRESPAFERDRLFWLERSLRGPQPPSLLPIKPLARSTRHERGAPSKALLAEVTRAADELKVEVASWINAAVVAWLASELELSSYTLGLPVTSRLGSVAVRLPCMAMNIVPFTLRWSDTTTFAELALAARDEQRASRLHQRYRYEDLRKDLAAVGGPRRPFGVVVNWMPFTAPQFVGLSAQKKPLSAGPVEDLAIAFTPGPDGLRVDLEANPDAYDADTLVRCHRALLQTLSRCAEHPALELRALPRGHSAQASLAIVQGEALRGEVTSVLKCLLQAAERNPNGTAIEQAGQASLSYAELVQRVRGLSLRLQAHGVTAGARVAVLLPRTIDAVIAQLAVLWLGAAYLPLDPRGPSARTRAVLEDAAPELVLTWEVEPTLAEGFATLALSGLALGAGEGDSVAVAPESVAYVIYTSGSTGKPNGVMVSRGALDHFVAAARQRYAFAVSDRVLQFAPLAFDASVEEIMVTLASGATLVLRTDTMIESLPGFLRAAAQLRLSVLDLPTAFFHELVSACDESLSVPACVRLVIIGGEAAQLEHVARFRQVAPTGTLLLNTYGPTETTVVCTTAALAGPAVPALSDGELPIGVPLPGVSIAVVDGEHAPVAVGDEGQLCVLGPTLSNGYLGRAERTAERFVTLARLRGAPRAYLTGDRVRLTPNGQLIYIGRIDEELKISGYRVSPLEIETALLAVDGVVEAAVVTTVIGGGKQLVAFVVSSESSVDASQIRARLTEHVAAPAVPRHVVLVDRLPRDANGKIDRSLLRSRTPNINEARSLAATPFEHQVLAVWGEVLGVEIPNLDADFFALGGHSLLALRVAERLGRALGHSVQLSALFRAPTVRSLAELLAGLGEGSRERAPKDSLAPCIALSSGTGPALFCLPPADGLAWCYLGLARHLPQVALWGLQAPGLRGQSPENFDELVDHYLEQLLAAQPRGPYRLLGWSSGGGLAHALAARLEQRGQSIALLALLDAYPADMWLGKPDPAEADAWIMMLDAEAAAALSRRSSLPSRAELLTLVKQPGSSLADYDDATLVRMSEVALASMRAYRTARHQRIVTPITFFRAAHRPESAPSLDLWQPYASSVTCIDISATHLQMCSAASLAAIAAYLSALI